MTPRGRDAAVMTTDQCAGILRALGDKTRLRILESLLVRQRCVTDLVRTLQLAQPHVSHHLRILRDIGLVEGRRQGKHVCYRITPKLQRTLRSPSGESLDFGCCRISFPQDVLLSQVG